MARVQVTIPNRHWGLNANDIFWNPPRGSKVSLGSLVSESLFTTLFLDRLQLPRTGNSVIIHLAEDQNDNTGNPGPEFSDQMKNSGTITLTTSNGDTLTLASIGDITEPYSWQPANITEVRTFANTLASLVSDRSLTVVFDDSGPDRFIPDNFATIKVGDFFRIFRGYTKVNNKIVNPPLLLARNESGIQQIYFDTLNVREKTKTHISIEIEWNQFDFVSSYDVQMSTVSENGPWTTHSGIIDTNRSFTNLSSNTSYWFRVRARAGRFINDWSEVIKITTNVVPLEIIATVTRTSTNQYLITASATGGIPPYTFVNIGGITAIGNAQQINVTVTDSRGVMAIQQVTIPAFYSPPAPTPTPTPINPCQPEIDEVLHAATAYAQDPSFANAIRLQRAQDALAVCQGNNP